MLECGASSVVEAESAGAVCKDCDVLSVVVLELLCMAVLVWLVVFVVVAAVGIGMPLAWVVLVVSVAHVAVVLMLV